MALKIIRGGKPRGMLVADRRLYLTADKSEVVEDGDPGAAFLFTTPGYEVPASEVERYGLSLEDGQLRWGTDAPASEDGAMDQAAGEGGDASAEAESGGESDEVPLPDDLPHREEVEAAGVSSIDELAAIGDLTTLPGIGKAKAADIAAYMAAQNEGDAGES